MSVSLSRILVATDFSPSATKALRYADVMADMFRAELHVLNIVIEPVAMPAPDGTWYISKEAVAMLVDRARQDLKSHILDAKLRCGSPPIQAVEVGLPVDQILAYAKSHQIDVIVLGTQGHRGLSRLLLGSVAEKVVRLATCPVLTVHADQ